MIQIKNLSQNYKSLFIESIMSDMGEFFPETQKLTEVTPENLSSVDSFILQKRPDLAVYHLAYQTKKLRPCTIKRMIKRQERINKKKMGKNIPKSPQQVTLKAEKGRWFENTLKNIKEQNSTKMVDENAKTMIEFKKRIKKRAKRNQLKKKEIRTYQTSISNIPNPHPTPDNSFCIFSRNYPLSALDGRVSISSTPHI